MIDIAENHNQAPVNPQIDTHKVQLAWAVKTLVQMQGGKIERTRFSDALFLVDSDPQSPQDLTRLLETLGFHEEPIVLDEPDNAFLPLIAFSKTYGWGVITNQNADEEWLLSSEEGVYEIEDTRDIAFVVRLKIENTVVQKPSFKEMLISTIKKFKGVIVEAVFASILINVFALAVSLFSMQVYDRVIPTNSQSTLIILAVGVFIVIFVELLMKFARSKIMDYVVVGIDSRLSREVFQRLLDVRTDKLPNSVGTMAAQLRGYEQVRSFFTATTLFTLVDIPMAVLFLAVISLVGSPYVAIIPLAAAIVALILGFYARKKVDEIAMVGAAASYRKTGLLVETVEGVETIKAGAGSWKFLSRWLDVMGITVKNDLDMKHATDYLSYVTQSLQQCSYVGVVIMGSFVVMSGEMTMGGLIACSILGGRVLAPVMAIPNLLMQHSHAKAAQKNIESLFSLETDNHNVARPLSPKDIKGNILVSDMSFNYQDNDNAAITVSNLQINQGERVAILGTIGSGKSTLLKLLSGLYAPTSGKILVDGLDLQQISRETVAEQFGYLQQDHRLFEGTLRDNLLIGLPIPTDDVLHNVLTRSGLIKLVSSHSKGLDLPISEGGKGLSGGQKQLVAFTRILLCNPNLLLLDEPTASMDTGQENRCISVLAQELQANPNKTLVLSTHRKPLLQLVDRLIIIADNKVVMDGPKEKVLQRLQENSNKAAG